MHKEKTNCLHVMKCSSSSQISHVYVYWLMPLSIRWCLFFRELSKADNSYNFKSSPLLSSLQQTNRRRKRTWKKRDGKERNAHHILEIKKGCNRSLYPPCQCETQLKKRYPCLISILWRVTCTCSINLLESRVSLTRVNEPDMTCQDHIIISCLRYKLIGG